MERPILQPDFASIFDATAQTLDGTLLMHITAISNNYPQHTCPRRHRFHLSSYAGMLAEENKAYTPLGKRIKRLGVYQVVMEGVDPP